MNENEDYTAKEAAFRLLDISHELKETELPGELLEELRQLGSRFLNHLEQVAIWLEGMEEKLQGWSQWKR